MKKNKLKLFSFLLMSTMIIPLFGCTNNSPSNPVDPDNPPVDVTKETISIENKIDSLYTYSSFTLKCVITNTLDNATWSSSDDDILSVDQDGCVTTKGKVGSATVYAKVGEASDSCEIKVLKSDVAAVLQIAKTDISITEGDDYYFDAQLFWDNSDISSEGAFSTFIQDENATNIIDVTNEGGRFKVSGIGSGETSFYVTADVREQYVSKLIRVVVKQRTIGFELLNSDITLIDGSFAISLATKDAFGWKKDINLTYKVYYGSSLVESPEVVWTSSNPGIVSISGNVVSGLSYGNTILTGTCAYQGVEGTVQILVSVMRSKTTILESITFDAYHHNPITIDASKVHEDTGDVILRGKKVGVYSNGVITFSGENIPTSAKELGKNKLYISTDYSEYELEANVYSMIINDVDDLNAMRTVAFNNVSDEEDPRNVISDGYFVLGNNIEYSGQYQSIGSLDYYYVQNGRKLLVSNVETGFRGVFDGQGYNINNFSIKREVEGGLFANLQKDGVIKNVSFTNAVVPASASLIASYGDGVIENIYANYKSLGEGEYSNATGDLPRKRYAGTAYVLGESGSVGINARINNLVVDLTNTQVNDEFYQRNATYIVPNVIAVSNKISECGFKYDTNTVLISDNEFLQNWSGADHIFNSHAEYLEKGEGKEFNAQLDKNYWTIETGTPIMKQAAEVFKAVTLEVSGVPQSMEPNQVAEFTTTYPNAFVEIECDSNRYVSISLNKITAGDGNNIGRTNITFSSVFNKAIKKEFAISLISNAYEYELQLKKIDLNVQLNASEDALNYQESYSIDISEAFELVDDIGILDYVLTGKEVLYSGFSIDEANKTLNVDYQTIKNMSGNFELVIRTSTTAFKLPVTIVSKVLKTKADIMSWWKVAKIIGDANNTHIANGHFELGNDIDMENSVYPTYYIWDSYSVKNDIRETRGAKGFQGIFDGCGYAIKNFQDYEGLKTKVDYHERGFIPMMGTEGIFRNIAFKDMVQKDWAFGIVASGSGTVENVYVSLKYQRVYTRNSGLIFGCNFNSGILTKPVAIRNVVLDYTYDGFEMPFIAEDGSFFGYVGSTTQSYTNSPVSGCYVIMPASSSTYYSQIEANVIKYADTKTTQTTVSFEVAQAAGIDINKVENRGSLQLVSGDEWYNTFMSIWKSPLF